MLNYILKKTTYSLLVLWGVISLIFVLFNVLPGDPARLILGQRPDAESIEMIKKDLGLDQAKHYQYLKYLNDLSFISIHSRNSNSYFYLDSNIYPKTKTIIKTKNSIIVAKLRYLRRCFQTKNDVSSILKETIPNTVLLALASIFIASFLGIIWGVFAALTKNSFFDRFSIVFSAMGMSIQSFFAAILMAWIFAFVLHDITGLNLSGNLYHIDDYGNEKKFMLKNLILPAITLGIRPLTIILQLTRNSLLEVLSSDYIRTAKAMGYEWKKTIRKYALKNTLNPVVSAVSGWFASMLAGVVFVEYIFGWKGLGYLIVDALNNYDLPVIMGCVLIISIVFILINLAVDVIYSLLDPRIKL